MPLHDPVLRVLVFTSLYPSASRPRHGVFVETRLRELRATGKVDIRVIAPVPWFPVASPMFGGYAAFAATPPREARFDIEILHPRYPMVPRFGVASQPYAMALAGLRALRTLQREGFDCDVIDAHYFYPDGVAAGALSRWTGKPFVVTARGSDLNLVATKWYARSRIVATARRARRVLCVSAALRQRATEIGISEDRIEVSRNGVDTKLFCMKERGACRSRMGVSAANGHLLLCVGNLVPEKGHALAIDALALLPDCTLLIIGDGRLRRDLQDRAERNGVGNRVVFMPSMPQERLVDAYNAADVLIHPSEREGWPNVLLEAIACGTRVVATDVGGVREIVHDAMAGIIVESRSAASLAAGTASLLAALPQRDAVRRYATSFGWSNVAQQCVRVLQQAAGDSVVDETRSRRCAT